MPLLLDYSLWLKVLMLFVLAEAQEAQPFTLRQSLLAITVLLILMLSVLATPLKLLGKTLFVSHAMVMA